jgi:hypothetical protein
LLNVIVLPFNILFFMQNSVVLEIPIFLASAVVILMSFSASSCGFVYVSYSGLLSVPVTSALKIIIIYEGFKY